MGLVWIVAIRLFSSSLWKTAYLQMIYQIYYQTRRRMARERRGAGSSLVSMETPYDKTIY